MSDDLRDPTLPHEMQQVRLTSAGEPYNIGWVSGATRDELLNEGSRTHEGWQFAAKHGDGERELGHLDAIDDELDRRDGATEAEIEALNEQVAAERENPYSPYRNGLDAYLNLPDQESVDRLLEQEEERMTLDPAEFVAFDPAVPGGFRELTDAEAQTLRDTPTTEAHNARGVEIDHGYPSNRDGEALRDAADWAAAGGRFDEADSADQLAAARVGEPHTEQLSWEQLARDVQNDLARDDPGPRIDPPAVDIAGRDVGMERD